MGVVSDGPRCSCYQLDECERCYCADPSDDGLCYCVPDCVCAGGDLDDHPDVQTDVEDQP